MDWARAIEINQTALSRIVAGLLAMVGLTAESALSKLPRPLYYQVMRILRPAESAVRRLIVIAARGVVMEPQAIWPGPKGRKRAKARSTNMAFQLFDTRKRFDLKPRRKYLPDHKAPRVLFMFDDMPRPSWYVPVRTAPAIPEFVDASRLGRRLQAIKRALDDLPGQAKRLVRWQARRKRMASPKFRDALRQGPPPGHRKKPKEEVDWVLKECHALARDALREDSS